MSSIRKSASPPLDRRTAPPISIDVSTYVAFDWPGLLIAVWAVGVVVMLLASLRNDFALWGILRRCHRLNEPTIVQLLKQCQQELHIRRRVRLLVSPDGVGPAWPGPQPRIVLPVGWSEMLSTEQLRFVLLHELIHIRRHDVLISYAMQLARIVHWFNPAVWLAMAKMRTDAELACDAAVLKRTARVRRCLWRDNFGSR